ncbi:hypothetical protein [Paucibacter sp. KCTC 42545]|uniref:hypothetical protein n=1 Tax=Paucibacter sp. KCTC 42545 TaxID=1768242 RepID=UPI000733C2AC|nr:hypothetical protein [Paucibacter sp. KCTC 42545]ALT76317.1 hypothetical protein AT984_02955 [Paucibacter sp. KCTC 42545]
MREPAPERAAWRPARGLLLLALGLAALGVVGGWWMLTARGGEGTATGAAPPVAVVAASAPSAASAPMVLTARAIPPAPVGPTEGQSRPAVVATSAQPASATGRIWRQRDPNGDLSPDLADYVNEGERPTMAEVIDRLHQAGVYTGLGAFSPPGTRPALVGLAVPEDFVLPEGYVRHHQATDDGKRIEPILMFAPDYQFFDAAKQPLAIPKNRVVPPELAPPGMPVRRIVIPAPLESARPAP